METDMAQQGRRLSDKVIEAFYMACDNHDKEVAEALYKVLEISLTRHGGKDNTDNRQNVEFIAKASDRLNALRAA